MSPTYKRLPKFFEDLEKLTPEQLRRFRIAVGHLVEDLKAGRPFRKGLRVKRIQGTNDIWEMTWAPDGRATWEYGDEQRPGERHVIWRRVGTHDIFKNP